MEGFRKGVKICTIALSFTLTSGAWFESFGCFDDPKAEEIAAVSLSECKQKCPNEQFLRCRSISYDAKQELCKLSPDNRLTRPSYYRQHCNNTSVVYADTTAADKKWMEERVGCIHNNNLGSDTSLSWEECKKRCIDMGPSCRLVEYSNYNSANVGRCWIGPETRYSVPESFDLDCYIGGIVVYAQKKVKGVEFEVDREGGKGIELQTVTTETDIPTSTQCGAVCATHGECLSFGYSAIHKICRLYGVESEKLSVVIAGNQTTKEMIWKMVESLLIN